MIKKNAAFNICKIYNKGGKDIDPRLYHLDDMGHLLFSFDSIKSVKDVVVVGS